MLSTEGKELLERSPPSFQWQTGDHFFLVAGVTLTRAMRVPFPWREVTDVFLYELAQRELIVVFGNTTEGTEETVDLLLLPCLLRHDLFLNRVSRILQRNGTTGHRSGCRDPYRPTSNQSGHATEHNDHRPARSCPR